MTLEADLTTVLATDTTQTVEDRRLAGAIGTDQGKQLSRFHGETDIL